MIGIVMFDFSPAYGGEKISGFAFPAFGGEKQVQ